MTISYAIPVKDEITELPKLLHHLLENKRSQDEIVILYDSMNGSEDVEEYLRAKSKNGEFLWLPEKFSGDFSAHKNKLNSLCHGDWIFQIDADEVPDEYLTEVLPEVLEQNTEVDLYFVPRVNVVRGITDDHIKQWRWNVNEKRWVNWPDYQTRIYRNSPDIKWVNKVHERVVGFKNYAVLPQEAEYALWHMKDIDRQERQNEYYDTLM